MTGFIRIALTCSLTRFLNFWNRPRNSRDMDIKRGAPEIGCFAHVCKGDPNWRAKFKPTSFHIQYPYLHGSLVIVDYNIVESWIIRSSASGIFINFKKREVPPRSFLILCPPNIRSIHSPDLRHYHRLLLVFIVDKFDIRNVDEAGLFCWVEVILEF